jgi:hypothetical protein
MFHVQNCETDFNYILCRIFYVSVFRMNFNFTLHVSFQSLLCAKFIYGLRPTNLIEHLLLGLLLGCEHEDMLFRSVGRLTSDYMKLCPKKAKIL